MASSSGSISSSNSDEFWKKFPQTSLAIRKIQKDPCYLDKCSIKTRYLSEELSKFISSQAHSIAYATYQDFYKERREIVNTLAIDYAKETYQITVTSELEELLNPIEIVSYLGVDIFQAEGLHPQAKQRSWQELIIQIFESFLEERAPHSDSLEAQEGRIVILTGLLPKDMG